MAWLILSSRHFLRYNRFAFVSASIWHFGRLPMIPRSSAIYRLIDTSLITGISDNDTGFRPEYRLPVTTYLHISVDTTVTRQFQHTIPMSMINTPRQIRCQYWLRYTFHASGQQQSIPKVIKTNSRHRLPLQAYASVRVTSSMFLFRRQQPQWRQR